MLELLAWMRLCERKFLQTVSKERFFLWILPVAEENENEGAELVANVPNPIEGAPVKEAPNAAAVVDGVVLVLNPPKVGNPEATAGEPKPPKDGVVALRLPKPVEEEAETAPAIDVPCVTEVKGA